MNILIDVLIVSICLIFLIKGSELILKGSVALAQMFGISELVIASTLIAFGTGLPTISVNIFALFLANNGMDFAIGNALGTNFVNIGLGLGIPAFLLTLVTKYEIFEKEIPIFLGICGLLTSFVLDGELNRIEGFAILLVYILTLFIIYQYSLKEIKENINSEEVDVDTSTISVVKTKDVSFLSSFKYILIGFFLLISFSILLVSMTGRLSSDLGISEYILGLTIIGVGTSLPMIVTSVKSARRGFVDIIFGNVFGSTIANIGLGLGLPAIFTPLIFNTEYIKDIYYFNILNIIVVFSVLVEMKLLGKNKTLNWVSGLIIILFYIIYIFTKIF